MTDINWRLIPGPLYSAQILIAQHPGPNHLCADHLSLEARIHQSNHDKDSSSYDSKPYKWARDR